MRKLLLHILTLALVLTGCEVIPEDNRLIHVAVEGSTSRTHVLLDFTGFRCVNCPLAAQTAQDLTELYCDQLIVVSLHPASNPFTQGLYDYTCPAADSIYLALGGTASTPFPTGNVDLLKTDERVFYDHAEWPALVQSRLRDSIAPVLRVEASLDTSSLSVSTTVYLSADSTMQARLAIWLTEDSIHGVQAMPDGSVNTDYIHRHMLRTTAFESPWGIPITLTSRYTPRHAAFSLPADCRPEQCHVIALLLDINDQHILQAYETNLDDGNLLLP